MCQLIKTYRHVHTMPWTTNSFKIFHGTIFSWISWFDFWSQNINTVNIIHSCMFGTSIYGVCVIIIFQLLLLSAWHILMFTIQKADLEMLKALCHAWLLHSCKIQLPCMGYEVMWLSVMCGRRTCTFYSRKYKRFNLFYLLVKFCAPLKPVPSLQYPSSNH